MIDLARERLGPAAAELVAHADAQTSIREALEGGMDLEDAVLSVVHASMGRDRRLANEFLGYFLNDVLALGRSARRRAPHLMETGDLVQSVFGDVWSHVKNVRFDGRARFLSYLAQALRWKASDRARRVREVGAGLDPTARDRAGEPEEGRDVGESLRPLVDELVSHEEELRVQGLIRELPERQRRVVSGFVAGRTLSEIADELGLSAPTVRRDLRAAIDSIRKRL